GKLLVDGVAALELFGADRKDFRERSLELVADADLHRLDSVEHVELGDAQAGDAVQLDRALQRRGVEPAGAPRPAGGGAELLSALAQPLADVVGQLGRERPAADARCIRFCNPQNIMQVMRAYSSAGGRGAGDAVGGRDERIGAVVDVEERALRTLEQQVLARAVRVVQSARHVGDELREPRRERQRFVQGFLKADLFLVVKILEDKIMELEQLAELLCEARGVEEILQADRAPRHLVLVGRADAAAGSADLALALRRFARVIERRVIGKNQRAGFADRKPRDYAAHAGRLE